MTRNISLLTALLSLLTSAKLIEGSHPYRPLIAVLRSADLVLTARVIRIQQHVDGQKVALAEPYDIVKGQWHQDSLLKLPIRELPPTGIVSSAAYEVLYDSGATYLLALNSKEGRLSLADYPWVSRIAIDGNSEGMADDVRKMMLIDKIEDLPKRATEYPKLLTSHFSIIRESIVWELGRMECPEALPGLITALRDTSETVLDITAESIFLLGTKGITSPQAAASIESTLVRHCRLGALIKAYAVQKGRDAYPLLRRLWVSNDHDLYMIIDALSLLPDPDYYHDLENVILRDPQALLKSGVLNLIRKKGLLADSLAIPFAIRAIDRNSDEYVQVAAIKLLEERAGRDFGNAEYVSPRRRQQIIGKWKKWYKDWLKKK